MMGLASALGEALRPLPPADAKTAAKPDLEEGLPLNLKIK
jgi:hypothetical protein